MTPYSGFAAHRLPLRRGASWQEHRAHSLGMLLRALKQGNAVAFVGSGPSTPLGYPSWAQLAQDAVDQARSSAPAGSDIEKQLGRFAADLKTQGWKDPTYLKYYIGVALRVLGEAGAFIRKRYSQRQVQISPESNPYAALVRLPIRRFVTTNYDCSIEQALAAERSIPWESFGIDGCDSAVRMPLSFTQQPRYREQLALFALAGTEKNSNMVFHCHGRFDEPESIILSEADYQRWYLADQSEAGRAFRQTVALLLESNPLIFIGYSLSDDDLLRPLRSIGALHPDRRNLMPNFVIVEGNEEKNHDCYESLWERYGLHVIAYDSPDLKGVRSDKTRNRKRATELRGQLEVIAKQLGTASEEWLSKPTLREVEATNPGTSLHFGIPPAHSGILGPGVSERLLPEINIKMAAGNHLIGLVGPGGCGKKWHAMQLIQRSQGSPDYSGRFFWSTLYADDLLTGLDRLLKFLDPDGLVPGGRLKRLSACLKQPARRLIVLDGIDRYLKQNNRAGRGVAIDSLVCGLLEVLKDRDNRSVVLLTSRLWPEDFEDGWKIDIGPLRSEDLAPVSPFNQLGPAERSALCALLSGHAYALLLAAHYLAVDSPDEEEIRTRAHTLKQYLSEGHPGQELYHCCPK